MRSTREYDAFGPWIDRVRAVDDVPPLYRNAGIDPAMCRLVLKVPREIERRNATPDMHLYDVLIAVDDETLTVLRRRGDTYDTTRVTCTQIVALEDSVSLLDGRLTVYLTDGTTVSIPYNGASQETVHELVALLRQLYLGSPVEPEAPAATFAQSRDDLDLDLGPADTALVTVYNTVRRTEPRMHLIGMTTRHLLVPLAATSVFFRALHSVWPTTLLAAIVVADDREIQVFHRREWFARLGSNVYSLARTVLARDRITGVQVSPHERYAHVQVVTVTAGQATVSLPLPDDPEGARILASFDLEPGVQHRYPDRSVHRGTPTR
ncbi:MAG: hypothetical protein QG622_680 [Actinomycetota bacterium]|nr:hypothetical protein [Actinomycetota bacterium]